MNTQTKEITDGSWTVIGLIYVAFTQLRRNFRNAIFKRPEANDTLRKRHWHSRRHNLPLSKTTTNLHVPISMISRNRLKAEIRKNEIAELYCATAKTMDEIQ
jgi:hypothetical protein